MSCIGAEVPRGGQVLDKSIKIMGSSKSLNKQKNNQQTIEKKNKKQTKLLHGPWMESAPSLSREGLELLNVQDRDAFSLSHCMLALVIWEAAAAKQQPLPNTVVPASHCRDRGSWQTGEPGLMCSACKVCPKPGTELYTPALRRAAWWMESWHGHDVYRVSLFQCSLCHFPGTAFIRGWLFIFLGGRRN